MTFSAFVAERIGWYVYALRDPRDRRVFYIGKGAGNRVFDHAAAAVDSDFVDGMSPKVELIRQILAEGQHVETFILRHGLSSGRAAYEVEATVIDVLRLLDPVADNKMFSLTNLVLGHHHEALGLATTDVVASLYDAPDAPPIAEPVLLIKIPGRWTPQMNAKELYAATRHWWRLGDRRERAKYAFAVNRGVVREVYAIESWEEWPPEARDKPGRRWGFTGRVASEMSHYRNTSVRHLYARGDANPVKYVNC